MGDLSGRTTGFFQGCYESKCACVSVCGEGREPGEAYIQVFFCGICRSQIKVTEYHKVWQF